MTRGRSSSTRQRWCGSKCHCHLQKLTSPNPAPGPREINSPGAAPHWGNSDHSQSAFYCQLDPNTKKHSTPSPELDPYAHPDTVGTGCRGWSSQGRSLLPSQGPTPPNHSPRGSQQCSPFESSSSGQGGHAGLQHRAEWGCPLLWSMRLLGLEDGGQGYGFWALSG